MEKITDQTVAGYDYQQISGLISMLEKTGKKYLLSGCRHFVFAQQHIVVSVVI